MKSLADKVLQEFENFEGPKLCSNIPLAEKGGGRLRFLKCDKPQPNIKERGTQKNLHVQFAYVYRQTDPSPKAHVHVL